VQRVKHGEICRQVKGGCVERVLADHILRPALTASNRPAMAVATPGLAEAARHQA